MELKDKFTKEQIAKDAAKRQITENLFSVINSVESALKENGVKIKYQGYISKIKADDALVAGVALDKLDFTEHDKKFIDEIECWKKKCSDLSNYNKQLKYDLEKCENKKNENKELPFDPLEVVDILINETYEHSIPFTGRKTESSKYGIDELEQIAEHLLVYCKHNNIEVR